MRLTKEDVDKVKEIAKDDTKYCPVCKREAPYDNFVGCLDCFFMGRGTVYGMIHQNKVILQDNT